MKKTTWLVWWLAAIGLGGCAGTMGPDPTYGVVIKNELDINASTKEGVAGVSNTGIRVFANSHLDPPKVLGHSGGTSSYGGMGVPQWVRVTWRKDTQPGEYWTTGTIVGDYKVDVASRLPPEVLKYASEKPGRAIRLIFRIKDDGVLLGWDVQEALRGDSGWVRSLHGGDFPCDPVSPYATRPTCTSGYLKDAPWYHP